MKLKKTQVKKLKSIIESERQRILDGFESQSAEEFHIKGEDRLDEVDQASSEYDRAHRLRFRSRNMFYAKKLSKALEKIELNEYGTCEDCDGHIKFERLLARPTAELCISCKDEAEREEQGNFVARQSKSLGQRVELAGAM